MGRAAARASINNSAQPAGISVETRANVALATLRGLAEGIIEDLGKSGC